jgi:hypothetical protein
MCSWFKRHPDRFLSSGFRSINLSSFQRHWDVSASLLLRERLPTKIVMALQRAVRARLYKLPLAAALQSAQSRRPDLIEFVDMTALALPREKLSEATARRRCRDRAPASANAKQP